MSRIRTIKPEFFTSEDIVSLSPLARLFYVSLWCESDREGRFEWKPRTFKLRYLPGDDCDVEELALELTGAGLVDLYEVEGKQYAQIPSFTKHQVINNRESLSTFPAKPCDAPSTRESGAKAEGKEGKGKEGVSTKPPSDLPPAPAEPPVVSIPLVDKSEFPITQPMIDEWQKAYPAVDVAQQAFEMRAWSLANAANRKTARGVQAFVIRWLGKEQDKAPRVASQVKASAIGTFV